MLSDDDAEHVGFPVIYPQGFGKMGRWIRSEPEFGSRISSMSSPLEIVKSLYAKLTAGDPAGALALMTDDIEWITMMDYKSPFENGVAWL